MDEEKLHELIRADGFMDAVKEAPEWVFETTLGIMILWRKKYRGLRKGLARHLASMMGEEPQ